MSAEQIAEVNELFEKLGTSIKDKRLRHLLSRLNKQLNAQTNGAITMVNWNS